MTSCVFDKCFFGKPALYLESRATTISHICCSELTGNLEKENLFIKTNTPGESFFKFIYSTIFGDSQDFQSNGICELGGSAAVRYQCINISNFYINSNECFITRIYGSKCITMLMNTFTELNAQYVLSLNIQDGASNERYNHYCGLSNFYKNTQVDSIIYVDMNNEVRGVIDQCYFDNTVGLNGEKIKKTNEKIPLIISNCVFITRLNTSELNNFETKDCKEGQQLHPHTLAHYTYAEKCRAEFVIAAYGCQNDTCPAGEGCQTFGFGPGDIEYTEKFHPDINTPTRSSTKLFSPSVQFSYSQEFTYSGKFSQSFFFSNSEHFSGTKDFTDSIKFSETKKFSESSDFSNSKFFSKTLDFTNSKGFSETDGFTKTGGFSKTDGFTKTNMFSLSFDFTRSKDFTNSDDFLPTVDFNHSNSFTPSSKFTPSKSFTKSSEFSKSDAFTKTDGFTKTGQFSYSSVFTTSDFFSNSKGFSTSNPFSTSAAFSTSKFFSTSAAFSTSNPFSTSAAFSTSNPFSTSAAFSTSKFFSNSEFFTFSKEFSKTDGFTNSKKFQPSRPFSDSSVFTPSEFFSNSETLLKIKTSHFSKSNIFSKSSNFTESAVVRGVVPVQDSDKGNKLGSGAIAGIVVGILAALAIIALLIFFFIKKRRMNIDDEEIETLDENQATMSTENPIYNKDAEDDPFKDDFYD